ncbi:MAG: hypothetical protein PVJ66_03460 [Gammaproteobacteria bacterium]|jgi:hypothetical protein
MEFMQEINNQILIALQRVALMMDARQVDASPLLATGSVTADPEMVEIVTRSEVVRAADTGDVGVEAGAHSQKDNPSTA